MWWCLVQYLYMKNHIKLLQYLLLVVYVLLSSVILIVASAPMLAVAAVLFLGPLVVLWQKVHLRTRLIPLIAICVTLLTAIVQIYAYVHGIWYELAPSNTSVFGSGPLESYVFSSVFVLYCIVLYEYFFDDKNGRVKTNYVAQIVGVLGILLAISLGYVYFFAATVIENAYAVLVAAILLSLVAIVGWREHDVRLKIFARALTFSLTILPISLVTELVMLTNNVRFFANTQDYIFSFQYFGYLLPLEEIFLLILLPVWIVVLYEVIFDDGV